jgi:uncharacterized protein (DUF58 family)
MSASRPQAEALLKRLEWTVVKRLDGLLQGDYRTLFRGTGLDFTDLREYQPHDDVRHIDWNVTARTQVPHVRVYNEERELTAWFVLDLSPSVDFGSADKDKRQVLTEFVGVVARMFVHRGNKVGAILSDGAAEHVVRAAGGRRHVMHLMDKILAHPRRLRAPPTDLGALIRHAASALKRRSAVFVVSDFVSAAGWERAIADLGRRHEVIAVRLTDPLESALPDLGLLSFEDAESGEQIFVDTTDPGFRRRHEALTQQWEERVISGLGSAGIDTLELSTADDLLEAIMRFSVMRKTQTQVSHAGVPQWTA